MFIVWIKALIVSSMATPCVYKLFKKFDSADTFGAWMSRAGWWLWLLITIALVCWLSPAGSGYDSGAGSPY